MTMFDGLFHFAFIGPGGPEFLLVMLVLLLMFGAKDAPRILRKLNEIFNQIRNTADGFKREVMYGDINVDPPACDEPPEYDEEYEPDDEGFFGDVEETLAAEEPEAEAGDSENEDGDARKT